MPRGGSCTLSSINLAEFVKNGEFDFEDFRYTVREAVNALNEVLIEGLPLHPLHEQRDSVGNWHQIGVGIFGLGDLLIKMGIRYGSSTSIELCNAIGYIMADEALKTSALLAKEHGAYPMYNAEAVLKSPYLHTNATPETLELIKQYGLYNSQLLTIAPTGSLSTMLGVTGGIEPIFANSYTRKTQSLHGKDEYYKVYTPIVKDYMEKNDISDEANLPNFFVTAGELNYKERIDMQSVWQKHIDASISSTVNVAKEFTVEETMDLYNYAWKKGLKGVTIFRDGCARIGVLTTTEETTATQIEEPAAKFDHSVPVTRKELGSRLQGSTYVKEVACGKLYITINRDADDNLVEVFIDSGKSGGCTANAECLGRYASAAMRDGMSIQSIIDITKGVKCSACTQVKGSKSKHIDGLSCGDVLARTISEEYNFFHGPKTGIDISKKESNNPKCPECGAELTFEGGCNICKNCGYSKCD